MSDVPNKRLDNEADPGAYAALILLTVVACTCVVVGFAAAIWAVLCPFD